MSQEMIFIILVTQIRIQPVSLGWAISVILGSQV